MRKINKKEKNNGMRYCTFCKREGIGRIEAVWRNQYLLATDPIQLACDGHKKMLKDGPLTPEWRESTKDVVEDHYYTEADYQTWMRL